MKEKIRKQIQGIIGAYKYLVLGIEKKAKNGIGDRAYGGIIRSGKGKLVESIAKELLEIAWRDVLEEDINRLEIKRNPIKVPLKRGYIKKIKNSEVQKFIKKNINNHYYNISVDWHVFIDDDFKLAVECKSYTENAMLKRILVDFTLLKKRYKDIDCALFQLESQLGGDYSSLTFPVFGSASTHTLISHFNIDLHIITLLEKDRKVKKPIHKKKFYKPLKEKSVIDALNYFKDLLKKYI